jgi:hypothetical protein
MNFIRALPSAADLWDRHIHLAAGPKLVLRLKSLVWLPTGKTEFLTYLTRSGCSGFDQMVTPPDRTRHGRARSVTSTGMTRRASTSST